MINLDEIKVELFAAQNEIITLQSSALNDCITLLLQHEDEQALEPIKQKIDRAAQIRAEMNL